MLGPAKPRRLDEPIAVSLEALVPANNFYRHLETTLDLTFVREWSRNLYADCGRPSIDPVIFFKLQLVMFFEGIRSERQLIAPASHNLAHRWYLGYALDEELPDHSSLARIRQRLGIDIFQRFFEKVVDLCQDAGLVWGRERYVDATKVEANAGIPSLIPRFYYDATTQVGDLFQDEADAPPQAASDFPPGIVPLPINSELVPPVSNPPWRLLEKRRLNPKRPSHRDRRTSDFRVSPTDPDASPMWDWGAIRLGYHDHYAVDDGKHRIILAALVAPADMMENVPLRDLLWRVCFRCELWPDHVTGDTTYGTTENIVALEDAGIRAFFPLPDFDQRTPFFGKGQFVDDAAADADRRPQGQPLPRRKTKCTEREVVYRADAATCHACPVKATCATIDHGRIVQRSCSADDLETVRGDHTTETY